MRRKGNRNHRKEGKSLGWVLGRGWGRAIALLLQDCGRIPNLSTVNLFPPAPISLWMLVSVSVSVSATADQMSSLKRLIACFVGAKPQLSGPSPGFSSAVSTWGVRRSTATSLGSSGWTCGCSELSNVDWSVPTVSQFHLCPRVRKRLR